MDLYKCIICGYVYDSSLGDPVGGIEPGIHFEDIPEGWVCPVCGAGKTEFE
jgi:rubredoxin